MVKIGINGFGRMGRLALRHSYSNQDIEFVAINEPHASAENMATLLEFDTVQGRWDKSCSADSTSILVEGKPIAFTSFNNPKEIPWSDFGVDLVLECSGAFRTTAGLMPHFENGAKRVVVSAPVKDGPPNIVMGVNHQSLDTENAKIVTAASCTTNCLAPVVRVLHDAIGIENGLVTTIHAPTNTQSVHDCAHKDPRRARASQMNLIPTSTNSATAVTLIIPELKGKLDSIAVRAPVHNASLTDCVFQMQRDTTVEEVNSAIEKASKSAPLQGILGYETRPLVSSDYARDPRSGIVDALSTRVTGKRLVKVMIWYDNEWGYVNRMMELTKLVAKDL
ncbi:MAG: ArsJ-associated glyceraldehyde-3-phosphate dehydrogenase [Deltaproteobacteria bacterium]|jgi:glyceraldehyde 3-phosphate dehydrogenase|nr:ArsJ-associated glyceraldehyde-3-phosphate dehydrogenase [Deltaproteobacteria bacterium]MBT6434609.1 ArsJ-associated glyceraldehyde-3-phosphate dehydrogenase [Deltaproteobacteria bacterium]MBT6491229.1 ArsJ-associated glyceraldehyde-3-phosphate dehydrogenase [Deltaproteobacteria bacterium]